MGLPDFIIIGAMKCGTSTLATQLGAQPGVFMTTPKEPNFFSDDAQYARGLPWYQALFESAPPHALKGEASTHYTKLPTYPETIVRMAEVLHSPRLVYVVRDPIARAVSQYIHEWSQGIVGEDPDTAFETHPEMLDYGRYAMQIAPFIETFGRDAICLTSLERLKASPGPELERIGRHIGMTAPAIWKDDIDAQNVSAERIRKLPLHGLLVANPVATALRRALVPKALRHRIRDARSMKERPQLSDALVARLRRIYATDLAGLRAHFPDIDLGFEQGYLEERVT